MYRTGHYGAALLAWAPAVLVLVALGRPAFALAGGAGAVALTPLPDYDQRVPLVSHRGVTHTVAFAVLVAALLAGAGALLAATPAGRLAFGAFGGLVGAVAVGAHLAADALTPAGVAPFWPVSGRRYSLGVTTASNAAANYLLLAAGAVATGLALGAGQALAG